MKSISYPHFTYVNLTIRLFVIFIVKQIIMPMQTLPRIVLVSTSHPGNIGSTARAMKTMGLTELYLVNPKEFPALNASELAAGADDILAKAVVTTSLKEALVGCHYVYATTARSRSIALTEQNPNTAAQQMAMQSHKGQVAVVFGNERTGLSNDELMLCQYQIHIPTDEKFSSLNLSQAVQIIAYEWRKHQILCTHIESKLDSVDFSSSSATSEEIEAFYEHLKSVLIAIDFLKPTNPRKLFQRLRRLFNRAQLEQNEVNILRGILTQVMRFGVVNTKKCDIE